MSIFVDSSVWFAATVSRDRDNVRAKSILKSNPDHITTDHVLIETWLLLNSRYRREVADQFWGRLQQSGARVETVSSADRQLAWEIGLAFPDQSFSIVDRTSFAVMQRLGLVRAASFDDDFAIYRYGVARNKAFEVVRHGHSSTFLLFHQAILNRQQITCLYQGRYREICPHILGHRDGQERALVYQFSGESSAGITRQDWRCLNLAHVEEAKVRDGKWHSGARHGKTQRCVDSVYIDVNTSVPNQPGRR